MPPNSVIHKFFTSLLFQFELRKFDNSHYLLNPNVSTIILKGIILHHYLHRVFPTLGVGGGSVKENKVYFLILIIALIINMYV